jgi:hypothetical protein
MLRESLKDASEIIQNILTQPLEIEGWDRTVSLLEAAKSYLNSNGQSEDLTKVLQCLVRYREPTETLVNELAIISDELQQFRK